MNIHSCLRATFLIVLGFGYPWLSYSQTHPVGGEPIKRGAVPPSVSDPTPPSRSGRDIPPNPSRGIPLNPSNGKTELPLPIPGAQEFTECQKIPGGRKVSFTLKPDSELTELIGAVKTFSCRPFILSSTITSRAPKITIIAPELVTVNEAYLIFLSALESMGFTVQPSGKALKIIPIENANTVGFQTFDPHETTPFTDQFFTRIFRLKYANPDTLASQLLSRLKSRSGDVLPYAPTKVLVITDNGLNIKRMEEIIKAVDIPTASTDKIWLIHLKNMLATDAKQELDQIFNASKNNPNNPNNSSQPFSRPQPSSSSSTSDTNSPIELSISQIIPDERTNSLIVMGTENAYLLARTLIEKLDVPGGNGGSRIYVYDLENGNAEELATTLQSVCGAGTGGSVPINRGPNATNRPNAVPIGLESNNQACQTAKITPNKSTNSLVIVSTNKEFLNLRDVIRTLDKPKRQVWIEADVFEIGVNKQRDLGVSFHGGYDTKGNGLIIGGLKGNNFSSLSPVSALSLPGLVGGLIGTPIPSQYASSFTGGSSAAALPPLFGVLIQASQTTTDIDFLQHPTILATDNEKATFEVGQNVPFLGGISGLPGTTGTSLTNFQSVQRQNVSIKLEITPHVNSSDLVRLEIDSDISDLDSVTNFNNLGPITNTRKLKTIVTVRDQQSIILGGILRKKKTVQETKIPLFGDIPILGYLFKTKSNQDEQRMLFISMIPHIIRNPGDLQSIFETKTRERQEFTADNLELIKEPIKGFKPDYEHQPGPLDIINTTIAGADKELQERRKLQETNTTFLESGPIESPKKL